MNYFISNIPILFSARKSGNPLRGLSINQSINHIWISSNLETYFDIDQKKLGFLYVKLNKESFSFKKYPIEIWSFLHHVQSQGNIFFVKCSFCVLLFLSKFLMKNIKLQLFDRFCRRILIKIQRLCDSVRRVQRPLRFCNWS